MGQLDFVYITGHTVMDGSAGNAAPKVKLTVSLPNGQDKVSVLVPVERADGLFGACFNQTQMVGKYAIRVISPGGGSVGNATFVVDAGSDPPDEDARHRDILHRMSWKFGSIHQPARPWTMRIASLPAPLC